MDSIAAKVSESVKVSEEAKTGGSIAAGFTAAPGWRKQRIAFWTTLVFAKALVLFPFYAPYLLG